MSIKHTKATEDNYIMLLKSRYAGTILKAVLYGSAAEAKQAGNPARTFPPPINEGAT